MCSRTYFTIKWNVSLQAVVSIGRRILQLDRLCTRLSSSNSMTFHDFFHELFKFSMTIGLAVTLQNIQTFPCFRLLFDLE